MAPSSKGLICFDLRDRGQCSNLQNCFFSHKFKGTGRVCKPFVDKGMCTNFNKCLYSHPKDRRGAGNWGTHWADDNPPSAKGLICFDLRDRGQCDFQNCWFSHDFKGTGTGCKPFVDKGMCTNFNKCLYSHPKDRRGAGNWGTHWADDNPPSAKGLICFDLRDRGQCDFQNCWFSHDFKGTGTGCKQFVDKGMCTNFKTCLNSHPKYRRGAGNEGAYWADKRTGK